MTLAEFKAWLFDYHCEMFPEVSVWLDDRGNQDLVLENWWKSVKWNTVQDLRRATDRMVAGGVEHPYQSQISRLPAALKQAMPPGVPPKEALPRIRWNRITGELTEMDG